MGSIDCGSVRAGDSSYSSRNGIREGERVHFALLFIKSYDKADEFSNRLSEYVWLEY